MSELIFKDFRRFGDRKLPARLTPLPAGTASGLDSSSGSIEQGIVTLNNVTVASLSRCSTAQARAYVPFGTATQLNILPIGVMDIFGTEVISVAAGKEHDPQLCQTLQFITGKDVRLTGVNPKLLPQAIFKAYNGDSTILESKISELDKSSPNPNELRLDDIRSSTGDVAQFLCTLIDYAIALHASDLHIIPRTDGCFLKIRIDGELYAYEKSVCNSLLHEQLVSRLKVLAKLDVTKHTTPQDGAFVIPLNQSEVHARLSIMPTVHGEKAVIRLSGYSDLIKLEDLGLDTAAKFFLEHFCEQSEGAMLVAGPTGSGKSTTMYSVMDRLVQRNLSLVSIEDPVEVRLACVAQTSINPKLGLDYESCLRSVLRQDPDVILLGEMRDEQSAKIAFQAALTGHLLLTTVHARNVFEVILRLRNLGVDFLTIAQATTLVLCQRLLPCLCRVCRVLDLSATNRFGFTVYRGVGCDQCDYSGYVGRTIIAETLWIDEQLSMSIIEGKISPAELRALTNQKNYVSFNSSVIKRLNEGKIDLVNYSKVCGP